MKTIRKIIYGGWHYFWGHIFAFFLYDKKYLKGRWFKGKYNGLCSKGWVWVTHDAVSRILLHKNQEARFPVSFHIKVQNPNNIEFHPDDLNNFQSDGIYFQAVEKIIIGRGAYIAPNVGLITANHDLFNLEAHMEGKPISIGEKCWIGMNSVILPGVVLGPHTIVGAGSVVTKSFVDGYCVIVGNPAKILKKLEIKENDNNESV